MTGQQQDLADELKRRSNARDASWEESNHPRDQSGQFGSGGEGGDKPKKRVGPYSLQRRNEIDDALKAVEAALKVGKDDEDDLAMDPPVKRRSNAQDAQAQPLAEAYRAGAAAFTSGQSETANPYQHGDIVSGLSLRDEWTRGFKIERKHTRFNATIARRRSGANDNSEQDIAPAQDAKPVGRWGGRAHKGA